MSLAYARSAFQKSLLGSRPDAVLEQAAAVGDPHPAAHSTPAILGRHPDLPDPGTIWISVSIHYLRVEITKHCPSPLRNMRDRPAI